MTGNLGHNVCVLHAPRLAVAAFVAAAAFLVGIPPASAHGVGGIQPTSYLNHVSNIVPRDAHFSVEVIDLGRRLKLINHSATPVIVLGYQGEPYLKVSNAGVFENRWSPAVVLNQQTTPSAMSDAGAMRGTNANSSAQSTAPANWIRLSHADSVVWHDHRAHWMSSKPPPVLSGRDGRRSRVVFHWHIPLLYGKSAARIDGSIQYVPVARSWQWPLASAVLIVVALFAASARPHRALLVIPAILFVVCATHVIGEWGYTGDGLLATIGAALYAGAGGLLCAVAIAGRSAKRDRAPWTLIAAVVVTIGVGIVDIGSWFHSQLPTRLPGDVARSLGAIALSVGVAGIAIAGQQLRRPAPRSLQTRDTDALI